MLLRDRKAPFTAPLAIIGYAMALLVALDILLRRDLSFAAALPPLISSGLAALLWFNAALLAWRLVLRAAFTTHAYGPAEGLRAIPRALVSNVINAAAAWRSMLRYHAILSGQVNGARTRPPIASPTISP